MKNVPNNVQEESYLKNTDGVFVSKYWRQLEKRRHWLTLRDEILTGGEILRFLEYKMIVNICSTNDLLIDINCKANGKHETDVLSWGK